MSDQQITCTECGDAFLFSAAEQSFYAEKGLASPPKRCKACRQARKAGRGPGSFAGHGAGGYQGGGHGPRRYSNDVNEYRSPMTGGVSDWGGGGNSRAPRGGQARGGQGSQGHGGYNGQGNARGRQ